MGSRSTPHLAFGMTLIVLLLAGCGGSQASPIATPAPTPASTPNPVRNSSLPTYSEIVSTYPAGTELNGTVATVTKVTADGTLTFAGGSLLNGCGGGKPKFVSPFVCYGSKITIGDSSVTLDGKTYQPGAKLTMDKDLHWIEVSSWD